MLEIQTDAAYRPETQEGGLGIILKFQPNIQLKYFVNHAEDNHFLEFLAIREALKYVIEQGYHQQTLAFYTDSKIVVQSIDKAYVKDALYRPILTEILELMDQIPLVFVKWIPEKQNRGADQLARQALLKQGIVMKL